MPFIADRDLLPIHPTLFREVGFLAQTLHRGQARIQSGKLTPALGEFPSAVRPGHVAVLDQRPLEIVDVKSPSSLTVSLPRASPDDPLIVPADTDLFDCQIATFDPQIALAHAQVLALLGLSPSEALVNPDSPGPDAVLNPADLRIPEALAALHLVYAAAAASLAATSPIAQRAEHFRTRFNRQRWRTRAVIDTNGDGLADAVRTMSTAFLAR